jgi:DEAD/DEAH box helicase domain-containing protein
VLAQANGLAALPKAPGRAAVPVGLLARRGKRVPVVWIANTLWNFEATCRGPRSLLGGDALVVLVGRPRGMTTALIEAGVVLLEATVDDAGDLRLWRALDLLDPAYRARCVDDPDAIFDDVTIEFAEEPGVRHIVRINGREFGGFQKSDLKFLRLLLLAAKRKADPDVDGGGWLEKFRLQGPGKDRELEEIREELRNYDHPELGALERTSLLKASPKRDGTIRLAVPPINVRFDPSLAGFELIAERQTKPKAGGARRSKGQKDLADNLEKGAIVARKLLDDARALGVPGPAAGPSYLGAPIAGTRSVQWRYHDRARAAMAQFTEQTVTEIVEQNNFEIIAREDLPGRTPERKPIPTRLTKAVREFLAGSYGGQLYSHQADAIDAVLDGHDVCLSTSTASGKSLVFMTVAAQLLSTAPSAKTLALYPARALIRDQVEKWQHNLKPFGIPSALIDGGVPTSVREDLLRNNRVILMTPDVAHAWMMSHVGNKTIATFLQTLRLVVLDEAHVYDGVFGTNMAYFLRRLQACAGPYRMICTTATLGEPADFVQKLSGRQAKCFTLTDDRSACPPRTILVARETAGKSFESTVALLVALAAARKGRFLAFGDSRKMVEQLVAATHRSARPDLDDISDDAPEAEEKAPQRTDPLSPEPQILPYRSGYEVHDRNAIQAALTHGHMVGVVSTSAMELGLDIGEIDLIVLLTKPPSTKAFWQRIGRAGRRSPSVCLVLGQRTDGADEDTLLDRYLQKPLEPNWLYLDNKYLQYTNALCAATELAGKPLDGATKGAFSSLPPAFLRMLENELNPRETVSPELYPLKQQAEAGPHREFPIRTGTEQDFKVLDNFGHELGNLTLSQSLREGYPGAIYYYLARPYRVFSLKYRKGEITVKRAKRWTTRPVAQTMVFPQFNSQALSFRRSSTGFLIETELQVSERVLGFDEQRGSVSERHEYGPMSSYSQRPLQRFFVTTGVCWYFPTRFAVSEALASRLLTAFCTKFGIQERDLGCGPFFSTRSPIGGDKCKGFCIFDNVRGSLRLTQRLAEQFAAVVSSAISIARAESDADGESALEAFLDQCRDLEPATFAPQGGTVAASENKVLAIARDEKAMFESSAGSEEVTIVRQRFTPQGLIYEVKPAPAGTKRTISAAHAHPLHGVTRMVLLNLETDEEEPVPE